MNKKELIAVIARETGIEGPAVQAVLHALSCIILQTVDEGQRLSWTEIGTFSKKVRPPRKARNLSKNTLIDIPQKNIVLFRPSKHFNDFINNEDKK